jgi:IS1 family transposase/transposase-like protein
MITQTITQVCRSCGSSDMVKNGTNRCGSQQYHCKTCGCYRVLTPKERYSPQTKQTILRLVLERVSLRGLQRVFGVWRSTILRWLRAWVRQLPRLSQTLLPVQPGDVLELDECWCYVQQHFFDRWLWTAMCRRTRQIVAYAIGDRTQATCRKLWHRLPHGYRDCPLITDGWESYQLVLPPQQHVIHLGGRGQTNHQERWYNTLRQRLGRYTRYTLSFSKDDTAHQLVVHAFIIHYNLAIQQVSLTM